MNDDDRPTPANDDFSGSSRPWASLMKSAGLLLFWTALAVIATTTAYLGAAGNASHSWLAIFSPMVKYFYVWGAAAIVMYLITPARYPGLPALLGIVLAQLVLFTVVNGLELYMLRPDGWPGWMLTPAGVPFLALGATVHIVTLLACIAARLQRRSIAEDRQRAVLAKHAHNVERELSAAKLELISTQISPHFMFNALNGVASLIQAKENERAYEMTTELGDLLRLALTNVQRDAVSLADEYRFVEQYVAVAKVQIDRRIEVNVHAVPECWSAEVPPMLLQPLFENALKFRSPDPEASIRIDLEIDCEADAVLRIDVVDNGPGPRKLVNRDGTGFGSLSIGKRLQLLYGDDARFTIGRDAGGGTRATITMPLLRSVEVAAA